MKLIIFQGNPGLRYRKTRHNVGFMVGDFYAKQNGVKWKFDKKFGAEIAVIARRGEDSTKQSRFDQNSELEAGIRIEQNKEERITKTNNKTIPNSNFRTIPILNSNSKFSDVSARDEKIILVKPQLFYNRTGEVVRKVADFYKKRSDLLVVCDDLYLEFGKIRTREQGSDGGNNGLKSIIQHLGTEDFARIRIGTGSELRHKMTDSDFVLGKFSRDEIAKLPEIYQKTAEIIDEFINEN